MTRTRDPADRRRSRVTVTAAGTKALAHADELAEADVAEVFPTSTPTTCASSRTFSPVGCNP